MNKLTKLQRKKNITRKFRRLKSKTDRLYSVRNSELKQFKLSEKLLSKKKKKFYSVENNKYKISTKKKKR